MAGGTGTRFWPHSVEAHPKQFLDILGTGKSLLQMTFDRFAAFVPEDHIFIATNDRYEGLVKDQLPSLQADQFLLEPAKRNTAPCIAYACYKIASKNPDAPIIIAPSDHAIFNEASFQKSVMIACDGADSDKLITIGIPPNRPATGYGYIKYARESTNIKQVNSFTEKPSLAVAEEVLASGDYGGTAGIFVWSGRAIMNAFEQHLPTMDGIFKQVANSFYTESERAVIKKQYLACEDISIDYGILEKSPNVQVVLGEFDWSDLGSWASLHAFGDKDDKDNVIRGEVLTYDVHNSLIIGKEDKLVVVQGLKDHVVVDTEKSLLICEKDNEAILKQAIAEIKSQGKHTFL
jgi:mannose-1-phosphate guanylyltransferase